MSRKDTGNCLVCGQSKSTITYKYCTRCRDEIEHLRRSQNILVSEATELIRRKLNIKVVIKKVEPKRGCCPCEWGRNTGGRVVCMFKHCVKVDGFNAGRVRLRGDCH